MIKQKHAVNARVRDAMSLDYGLAVRLKNAVRIQSCLW